jgi:dTDP-4-amino-4,6-dideoxygalactose transaminase
VRCKERDKLQSYLSDQGVQTLIHYPIPPHQQKAYQEWDEQCFPVTEAIHQEVLSLPMSPALTLESAKDVVNVLNGFNLMRTDESTL